MYGFDKNSWEKRKMKRKRWLWLGTAVIVALTGAGLADEHGHGHKKHRDRDDDDDRGDHYYREHERGEMRGWYHDHGDNLPPGFAKRDQLPPGLERQLRVRGTLPPGLRKKMLPCPEELEGRLPPPPRGCAHVVIGGHVVLVNRSSYMVLDIFHFER
jgi:Ni/Co efflux regulator RcnB